MNFNIKQLENLAHKNDLDALEKLAILYFNGEYVRKDWEWSKIYFKRLLRHFSFQERGYKDYIEIATITAALCLILNRRNEALDFFAKPWALVHNMHSPYEAKKILRKTSYLSYMKSSSFTIREINHHAKSLRKL